MSAKRRLGAMTGAGLLLVGCTSPADVGRKPENSAEASSSHSEALNTALDRADIDGTADPSGKVCYSFNSPGVDWSLDECRTYNDESIFGAWNLVAHGPIGLDDGTTVAGMVIHSPYDADLVEVTQDHDDTVWKQVNRTAFVLADDLAQGRPLQLTFTSGDAMYSCSVDLSSLCDPNPIQRSTSD